MNKPQTTGPPDSKEVVLLRGALALLVAMKTHITEGKSIKQKPVYSQCHTKLWPCVCEAGSMHTFEYLNIIPKLCAGWGQASLHCSQTPWSSCPVDSSRLR